MDDIEARIDELTNMATADDIGIYDYHFSGTKKAACMATDGMKAIMLDRKAVDGNTEECTLLFEEVSHFMAGALYYVYPEDNRLARLNRAVAEGKAKNWIVRNYVPFEALAALLREEDEVDLDDLAVYFRVPESIVQMAIDTYRVRGLL